jgi:hypothetical protein
LSSSSEQLDESHDHEHHRDDRHSVPEEEKAEPFNPHHDYTSLLSALKEYVEKHEELPRQLEVGVFNHTLDKDLSRRGDLLESLDGLWHKITSAVPKLSDADKKRSESPASRLQRLEKELGFFALAKSFNDGKHSASMLSSAWKNIQQAHKEASDVMYLHLTSDAVINTLVVPAAWAEVVCLL